MLLNLKPFFAMNNQQQLFTNMIVLKGDKIGTDDITNIIDTAIDAANYIDVKGKRLLEPHRQAVKMCSDIFDYLEKKVK